MLMPKLPKKPSREAGPRHTNFRVQVEPVDVRNDAQVFVVARRSCSVMSHIPARA